MANHTPPPEDPQAIARAEQIWGSFMAATKWSIFLVVFILIVLAAAFVTF